MRKDEAWPEDSPEYKAGNEIEKLGMHKCDVSKSGIVPAEPLPAAGGQRLWAWMRMRGKAAVCCL